MQKGGGSALLVALLLLGFLVAMIVGMTLGGFGGP